MSLYNALFGVNQFAQVWMAMLDLGAGDVGRFRDCYLDGAEKDADTGEVTMTEARICVYTRNGGGNREEYQAVIDTLAEHPCYARDYDDDFDCTYCTIEFRVPEKFKAIVNGFVREDWQAVAQSSTPPSVKWSSLFEKMQGRDGSDPQVKRALEVGRGIFEQLGLMKDKG